MAETKLSPSGFYVYALVDPRDDSVFYVGKGKGGRAWSHLKRRGANSLLWDRVCDVSNSGHDVVVRIVKDGLEEKSAFDLEKKMIADGANLTNILKGGQGISKKSRLENSLEFARSVLRRLKTIDQVIAEGAYKLPNGYCVPVSVRLKALSESKRDIFSVMEFINGQLALCKN